MLESARTVRHKAGKLVFGPDSIPDNLLFLVSGTIRVSQTSDNGRDIVLYRVEAGESCVLTTACMLAEEAYNAEGIAETDVVAVVLPRVAFDRLVAEEPSFRSFVLMYVWRNACWRLPRTTCKSRRRTNSLPANLAPRARLCRGFCKTSRSAA